MAKTEPQYECRHILVNGKKCAAVALLKSPWCFFHHRVYRQRAESQRRSQIVSAQAEGPAESQASDRICVPVRPPSAPAALGIDLPHIEDTSSVQLAINNVLHAIAADRVDTKRAGLLLYGLQIALSAVAAQERHPVRKGNTVTEVAYIQDGTPAAIVDPGDESRSSLDTYSRFYNVQLLPSDPILETQLGKQLDTGKKPSSSVLPPASPLASQAVEEKAIN